MYAREGTTTREQSKIVLSGVEIVPWRGAIGSLAPRPHILQLGMEGTPLLQCGDAWWPMGKSRKLWGAALEQHCPASFDAVITCHAAENIATNSRS
jgi:hypothetical protein